MVSKHGDIMARFSDKWVGEPNSGCWLWTASIGPSGYGQIMTSVGPRRAHRISYMLHKGPIPKGLDVRHKCDVRSCVNPAHLEIGTRKQNMQDAHERGRIARGFRLPHTKLSENEVNAIRLDRRKHKFIAATFGVTNSFVSMVKRGLRRSEVPCV